MPQDELWAASARVTGWHCTYDFDSVDNENDVFMFRPAWSKIPNSARQGGISIAVPTYMRWSMPAVFKAAHDQLLGGAAKDVPAVVRHELSLIRDGFYEGRAM